MRQQRVVKHERASKPNRAQDVEDAAKQPFLRRVDEEEQRCAEDAQTREESQEFFLGAAEIRNGA